MGRVTTKTWWKRWRETSSLRTPTSNGWLGEHLICSHAGNVWMDVKHHASPQGQHRRPGGSQEAPEGGRSAAHVDAGVLQRHQETLEGAQNITAHHVRPLLPPSFSPPSLDSNPPHPPPSCPSSPCTSRSSSLPSSSTFSTSYYFTSRAQCKS